MVNPRIEATSSDGYRKVIGLPRCGGSSRHASKENMITSMNGVMNIDTRLWKVPAEFSTLR